MAISLQILNGHLDRIFDDMSVTVVWNGSHRAVLSTPSITETVIIGGVDQKIEYQIFIKLSEWPSIPEVGERMDVLKFGGMDKMRVLGVRRSPDDAQLVSLQLGFARKA